MPINTNAAVSSRTASASGTSAISRSFILRTTADTASSVESPFGNAASGATGKVPNPPDKMLSAGHSHILNTS